MIDTNRIIVIYPTPVDTFNMAKKEVNVSKPEGIKKKGVIF